LGLRVGLFIGHR